MPIGEQRRLEQGLRVLARRRASPVQRRGARAQPSTRLGGGGRHDSIARLHSRGLARQCSGARRPADGAQIRAANRAFNAHQYPDMHRCKVQPGAGLVLCKKDASSCGMADHYRDAATDGCDDTRAPVAAVHSVDRLAALLAHVVVWASPSWFTATSHLSEPGMKSGVIKQRCTLIA